MRGQGPLSLLIILSLMTLQVGAQTSGWTSGISDEDVEENGVYLPRGGTHEVLQIDLYVENGENMDSSFDIEVEVCGDCAPETDQEEDWVVDHPDSIDVSGTANDTFTVSISNVRAEAFDAEQTIDLTVRIIYAGSQGLNRPDLQRTDEHVVVLRIPRLIMLDAVWKETPGGPITAGSETTLVLAVTNSGNSGTRIDTFSVSEGGKCPQLDLEVSPDVPLNIERGKTEDFRIRVSVSSAHPTKRCTITASARSDEDTTTGALATEVSIEQTSVVDESNQDSDTSSSTYLSNEDSGLPAPSFLLLLCVVGLVAKRERRRMDVIMCGCPSVEKFE